MILDWKKVAVVLIVVAVFAALALMKQLPDTAVVVGVSAMLGWVGGLFTPTPQNAKPVIVKADDTIIN